MRRKRPVEPGFDELSPDFVASTPAADAPPTPSGHSHPNADKPHFHGHRDRLRARFLEAGAKALHDYELLELVLFRAIPRRDVKPIAKTLLDRFGGFNEVLSADLPRLLEVPGLGKAAATELKLVQCAALRLAQSRMIGRPVISSWPQLVDYCTSAMAYESREQLRILFLDTKNILIADELQSTGTIDHTPVYTREVVKRALELNAAALILVHNHPSGDPKPSSADITMTRRIAEAAKSVGIVLHDHLVIGKGRHESFKSMGLL